FGDMVGSSLAGIVPWTPGEEPILMVPAPDADIKRSVVAALPDPALANPDAKDEVSHGGGAGARKGGGTGEGHRPRSPPPRTRRQSAREGGKMPRQRGLFRSARRTGARADRGRAGGLEPCLLGLLPERCLRRGLPECPPASRLSVHLCLRWDSRRGHRAGCMG